MSQYEITFFVFVDIIVMYDLDPDLFFGSIKYLVMEKLPIRLNMFYTTLYTFVECFSTKTLLNFFGIPLKKFVPTETDDNKSLENVFREYFGPFIIDPVLNKNRPSCNGMTNSDEYIHWLGKNTPDGFRVDDYENFVWLCDEVIRKWNHRRLQEKQIISGINLIINAIVYGLRFFIIFKCIEDKNIIPLFELGITMLFTTWVLKPSCKSIQT